MVLDTILLLGEERHMIQNTKPLFHSWKQNNCDNQLWYTCGWPVPYTIYKRIWYCLLKTKAAESQLVPLPHTGNIRDITKIILQQICTVITWLKIILECIDYCIDFLAIPQFQPSLHKLKKKNQFDNSLKFDYPTIWTFPHIHCPFPNFRKRFKSDFYNMAFPPYQPIF